MRGKGGIGGSNAADELASLSPWDLPDPISPRERGERLARARALMRDLELDALIVGVGPSLNYFAGVDWSPSERLTVLVLPVEGDLVIVCPAFEAGTLQAALATPANLAFWQEDEDPYRLAADALRKLGAGSVAVDPAMPFGMAERLRSCARGASFRDGSDVLDGCRMIKSGTELALLSHAKQITLEVQRRAARILREEISTREVRNFINDAHRALGAPGSTFCIVQFGRGTAYPHGLPGDVFLHRDQLVLIDTGCSIRGYQSDITRTYAFGSATKRQEELWQLEREAQQAAFDAVRPGRRCYEIDQAARGVLERAGLGPGYQLPGLPHRTGHGIGLAGHEAPYLVRGDETVLREGMCFSNEPMIVVPGEFGIRLEDHFHVIDAGAAWFTYPAQAIDAPFPN